MRVPPEIFREYDIRGVVGRDLDPETSGAIARAFGTYLRRAGVRRAAVGHDNRASSEALYRAAVQGLAETGCDVLALGLALTPMLYYALHHFQVEGGAMVTASHNPPEFNGFKLCHGPGTLYGAQIQEVREIAESGEFVRGAGRVEAREVTGAYLAMLEEKVRLGPRHLRVAVDCGNGTAGAFVPEVFRRWGCEVLPLYCDPDPMFPHHHPDPVEPRNLADLIRLVRDRGADLGIGIDGDGDRLGAVDDRGEILWGDLLMALFWREILPAHPGAVALVEVKCSQALVDEVRRLGGRPEWTRTGHSLIKARMREVGAVFTGEMSGHMFFADEYYGYDDAVYAAGRLLRILSNTPGRCPTSPRSSRATTPRRKSGWPARTAGSSRSSRTSCGSSGGATRSSTWTAPGCCSRTAGAWCGPATHSRRWSSAPRGGRPRPWAGSRRSWRRPCAATRRWPRSVGGEDGPGRRVPLSGGHG